MLQPLIECLLIEQVGDQQALHVDLRRVDDAGKIEHELVGVNHDPIVSDGGRARSQGKLDLTLAAALGTEEIKAVFNCLEVRL
jgi:hypothetical protein